MPVNNFEKQVQQKMDELQLRPSAEVWQEVEKRIRREKKRRGMILFILVAVLLAGGAGWWMLADKKQNNNSIAGTKNEISTKKLNTEEKKDNETIALTEEKNENKQDDKKEVTKNSATDTPVVTNGKPATEKKATATGFQKNNRNETIVITTVAAGVAKKKKQQENQVAETPLVKIDKPLVEKEKNNTDVPVSADEIVATINVDDAIKDSAVKQDVVAKSADKEIIKETAIEKDVTENTTAAAKNNPNPTVNDSSTATQPETAAKKDYIKVKKSKWELGFTAIAGVSKKAEELSLFGGSMKKSLHAYSSQSSSVTGGGNVGNVPYLQPSESEKGNFFQTGMYAKRKFTEKTGLSAGLNFSSYSTIQETGVYADPGLALNSSLPGRNYYTSGTTGISHTNHYYYLQLPVSFHWQLNKGTKLPFIWQNGFSTGLFMGSDALVYNSQSNTFYKDNKSFNKIQLSYQSGLYVKLFNLSKHPLTAGLLFNYHLSQLQKTNVYGANRLTSFGFQLGWLLKK